jgi:beta-galactosidase GanA
MDIMAHHDIKVILGTPTAAPPVWLAKKSILKSCRSTTRGHRQTRRHAPRHLPFERYFLGLFETHRQRHGRGAWRSSATHRVAD